MNPHRTVAGEIVTGQPLRDAYTAVAADWRRMAHVIRKEDAYASHVTEAYKNQKLLDDLAFADKIEAGTAGGFTIWQRVEYVLTGKSVPLLPPISKKD